MMLLTFSKAMAEIHAIFLLWGLTISIKKTKVLVVARDAIEKVDLVSIVVRGQ